MRSWRYDYSKDIVLTPIELKGSRRGGQINQQLNYSVISTKMRVSADFTGVQTSLIPGGA